MTPIADIRLRLLATVLLVIALSQVGGLGMAVTGFGLAMLLALIAGLDSKAWRRVLQVELFVVLLFLTLPFAISGTPLLAVGPLTASLEGLARAALIACKVSAAVLVVAALIGGVAPERIGAGLRALNVPERLVRLLLLTVRYLSVIRSEAARLHDAMRARGFVPRSNRHTWRAYGYLIGMLLVRALERAQRVEEAMRCRGFSGRFPHAALPAPRFSDWAGFVALTGLAAALLAGQFA
ncbi:MAG: cobalt ECF transporter T component CbiQ [Alphaproteobacteria bacterium]|nr:cobalt ECF transporter T component CbiQ [Alphaproteobacteria bacterium]